MRQSLIITLHGVHQHLVRWETVTYAFDGQTRHYAFEFARSGSCLEFHIGCLLRQASKRQ